MDEAIKKFFLILKYGLGERPENDEEITLSEKECKFFVSLAKKHDVAHLLKNAFQYLGVETDEATKEQLDEIFCLAVCRYEQLNFEKTQLFQTLEEAGIDYLPLKGAVIRSYYSEPWQRTSCDIDVLVREKDLKRAVGLLKDKLSYVQTGKCGHHVGFTSPFDVTVELHFLLTPEEYPAHDYLKKIWEKVTLVEGTAHCYEMSGELFALSMIAHTAKHFLVGGCGIRSLLDLWILKKDAHYDEEILQTYLKACGLDKFYENVCLLLDVWLSNGEHTELTQKMQKYILLGGIYGSKKNRIVLECGRSGGKKKYMIRRIFLPYKTLTVLYPSLKKVPFLYPVYTVARWFRVLFKGNGKHALDELKCSANTTEEEAEWICGMCTEMGLL